MTPSTQTAIYLAGGLIVGAGAIYAYDALHPATATPVRKTVTRTTTGRSHRHTVTQTITQTATHTAVATPSTSHTSTTATVTTPHMSLTVDGSQFRTNETVTLTCKSNPSITGLGGLVQIVDLTTGQTKISQSYGSAFTVKVTSSTKSTQTFQARFVKHGKPLARSNTISVTWSPQANDTNTGYCNTAGQCVHLTVTNYTQSGKTGLMIHLQPSASGFHHPVYQYWWLAPNGSWQSSGSYQDMPNYYLNANLNGDWSFAVYAREANAPRGENATQRAKYEAKSHTHGVKVSNGLNPTHYAHTASGSVTVSAPSSANTGQRITLSATAQGMTNPVYQFWYKPPGGSWAGAGPYGSNHTYTLAVNQSGTWDILAYARPASAPSNENAKQRARYEVHSTVQSITVQ